MNWLEATYQPTTLFSLKPSWATSSGGKSLLSPSPYAIKMALLDVLIRTAGIAVAEPAWPWLRDLQISIDLPKKIMVTNLFAKILRRRRGKAAPGTADAGPYQRTIGYREYVYYPAPIRLAVGVTDAKNVPTLTDLLLQISYLGKRGGLVQLLEAPKTIEDDSGFIRLTEAQSEVPARGLVQQLDDCGPKMNFAQANIYESKRPDRVVHHIVLPYRLAKASRSYTLYERLGAPGL